VATPQLLQAFGIKASDVNPDADVLTARPGLSGVSGLQLVVRGDQGGSCPGQCLQHPVIQEVGALPAGTSAPNTVITEHAIHTLGLSTSPQGWLIQTPHPPTAAQITNARLTVGAAGMTIETKNSSPSSAEILNYATAFGIALALGILAMTIGLIRSETARDLRTLTAAGAGSPATRAGGWRGTRTRASARTRIRRRSAAAAAPAWAARRRPPAGRRRAGASGFRPRSGSRRRPP